MYVAIYSDRDLPAHLSFFLPEPELFLSEYQISIYLPTYLHIYISIGLSNLPTYLSTYLSYLSIVYVWLSIYTRIQIHLLRMYNLVSISDYFSF